MIELSVVELGAGPTVVLDHGYIAPPSHLMPLARALAATHRVLVPDLPSYGQSPAVPGCQDLDVGIEALERAALSRTRGPTALVGHSLGGYRVLAMAIRRRVEVSSLVTLGGMASSTEEMRAAFGGMATALRAGPWRGGARAHALPGLRPSAPRGGS